MSSKSLLKQPYTHIYWNLLNCSSHSRVQTERRFARELLYYTLAHIKRQLVQLNAIGPITGSDAKDHPLASGIVFVSEIFPDAALLGRLKQAVKKRQQ